MGHPFSKFIPVKSSLPEDIFEKCGKQVDSGRLFLVLLLLPLHLQLED